MFKKFNIQKASQGFSVNNFMSSYWKDLVFSSTNYTLRVAVCKGSMFTPFCIVYFITQKELIGGQDSIDKESFVSQLWSSTFKDIFNKTKVSIRE